MAAWLDAHLPDTCRILVSPAERAQHAQALQRKFRTVQGVPRGRKVWRRSSRRQLASQIT
jgi:phosphohistidine phosphatase SixA